MADENNITTLAKRLRPFIKMAAQEMVPVTPYDHGDLTGLASDDHSQYVHISIARIITAVHTFDPTSATAPFLLSADAQGQTVIGLKADQLAKSVTAAAGLTGGGNLTADISLAVGAGNGIQVNADDIAVKLETTSGLQVGSSGLALNDTIAGAGLTISSKVLAVGAGTLISVAADTVGLSNGSAQYQVPLTGANPYTPSWANTSADPGAAISVLRTDGSGYLTLVRLKTDYIASKTAATNLTIQPTGDIILDPDGLDVLPAAAYEINLGALNKKYLTLHAAELWVETLVAQNTIATIGGRVLIGPTTVLTQDLSSAQTNLCLNPGFETAGGGGADVFANWTEYASNGTIIRDGTTPHGGSYSAKLTQGSALSTYIEQTIVLSPYYGYTVEFWTRGDGTNAGLYCVWDSVHGDFAVPWTSTGVTGTTWTLVKFNFVADAGSNSHNFAFRSANVTGAIASFDDVLIVADKITVKHNQMSIGDYVYMEAAGKVEWMLVLSGPHNAGPYDYYIQRNLDGSGCNDWNSGDAVFNTGKQYGGFIDLYSISSMRSGAQYGPTIQGVYRWGDSYSKTGEVWAIGNLNGLYGYSTNTFGVGLGLYGWNYTYLTAETVNGIKINRLDGAGGYHELAKWALDGTITVGETSGTYTKIEPGKVSINYSTHELFFVSSYPSMRIGEYGDGKSFLELYDGHIDFCYKPAGASQVNTMKLEANGNATFGRTDGTFANMYWKADDGTLGFRSGTGAPGVVINATGSMVVGGNTVLDGSGVYIVADTSYSIYRSFKFLSPGGGYWSMGMENRCSGNNYGHIYLAAMAGYGTNFQIDAPAPSGYGAQAGISASTAGSYTASMILFSNVMGGYPDCQINVPIHDPWGIVIGDYIINNPGIGNIYYTAELNSYKNSTSYPVYGYHPLTSPLYSTSWDDNEGYSSVGKTYLNLASVFSLPANVKAVNVSVSVRDSGSGAGGNYYFVMDPGGGSNAEFIAWCTGAANNSPRWFSGVLNTDGSSGCYYSITASGSGTMYLRIQIWGYWI